MHLLATRHSLPMLRFNQLFIGLLIFAFLGAFVLPQRASDRAKGQVQSLFVPVAWPVRSIAAWVHNRFANTAPRDEGAEKQRRAYDQIVTENSQLRLIVESFSGQLEQLKQQNAERAALGNLRDFCRPFQVTGVDPAPTREALILGGSTMSGLANDMPVIVSGGGVIGRVSQAGVSGAKVLLITDRLSLFTGRFVRVSVTPDGNVEIKELIDQPKLVRGAGRGQLVATLEKKLVETSGIRIGDWLELKDANWPPLLRGMRVATITAIKPSRDAGFIEINLAPPTKLTALREVMVMVKGQ